MENHIPKTLSEQDYMNNTLIVGGTATGKTATIIKPTIYELLKQKKQGSEIGLTIMAPINDVADMAIEMCEAMEIDYQSIQPDDIPDNVMDMAYSFFNESDIDNFFETSGVLIIKPTSSQLGDVFAEQMVKSLQNGVMRRKDTSIPHYMIFDECVRYINLEKEQFLSKANENNVFGMFTIQSLQQLLIGSDASIAISTKNSIISRCGNKIVFPSHYRDVDELIADKGFMEKSLLDISRFEYIYELNKNGVTQKAGIAKGSFVSDDWKNEIQYSVK